MKTAQILGGVAFAGLIVFLMWPRHEHLTVTAVEWQRKISIEEYRTVRETNEMYVPSGARITWVSHRRSCEPVYKTIENRRVKTGEDCHTITRYDYDIERFVHSRWVFSNGDLKAEPYWPEFQLAPASGPYGTGKERKGVMNETYSVFAKNRENEHFEWSTSRSTWSKFEPGQIVDGTFVLGRLGKLTHLEKD